MRIEQSKVTIKDAKKQADQIKNFLDEFDFMCACVTCEGCPFYCEDCILTKLKGIGKKVYGIIINNAEN